jgi:hypothetical protein
VRAAGLTVLLVTAVLGGAAPSAPAQDRSRERGPFLLVGLPSLGTLGWRCDAARTSRYALSFHAFSGTATDGVGFQAGAVSKHSTVQPGESIRFPYVHSHTQRFTIAQGTEPRLLRARVTVYFAPRYTYCFSYLVPRVTVRIIPHFNY